MTALDALLFAMFVILSYDVISENVREALEALSHDSARMQ